MVCRPVALILWYLTIYQNFGVIKRIFLGMILAFVAYLITGVLSGAHWGVVLKDTFIPHISFDFAGISSAVAQVTSHDGHIVNITSIGGVVSVPHLLPYSTAKFACLGFSEGLRAELTKTGVTVVTIVPGLMRTGSYVNAFVKGSHRAEFAWFSLLDSLPISSISARRAARQIVHATLRGDAEKVLSPQAKSLALLHGIAPGFTTDLLGLANRLLPGSGGDEGRRRQRGSASESPLSRSLLTALSQRAAQRYNQRVVRHTAEENGLSEEETSPPTEVVSSV
jgi:hypothetical protein